MLFSIPKNEATGHKLYSFKYTNLNRWSAAAKGATIFQMYQLQLRIRFYKNAVMMEKQTFFCSVFAKQQCVTSNDAA